MSNVQEWQQLANKEELYYRIGCDDIALSDQLLQPLRQKSNGFFRLLKNPLRRKQPKQPVVTEIAQPVDFKKTYLLHTENGVSNYIIADCCHPIPGDDVFGYVDENNHVIVHKLTCEEGMRLKSSFGGRIVTTMWETRNKKFPASLHVEGIDRMGILQEIISIISTTLAIYIRRLDIAADGGVFKCDLDVDVEDVGVVNTLCKKIKSVKGVKSAVRMNN